MAHNELKIEALRGGTIGEITSFLTDMEGAYNALYVLNNNVSKLLRAHRSGQPLMRELYTLWLTSTSTFQHPALHPDEIPPIDRLELTRVSIRSPGWWGFFGAFSILRGVLDILKHRLEVRKYNLDLLKYIDERRKDTEYREFAEKERLQLTNELLRAQVIKANYELVKDLGIDEYTLDNGIWPKLGPPFLKLGEHQDRGLIGGPVDEFASTSERNSRVESLKELIV